MVDDLVEEEVGTVVDDLVVEEVGSVVDEDEVGVRVVVEVVEDEVGPRVVEDVVEEEVGVRVLEDVVGGAVEVVEEDEVQSLIRGICTITVVPPHTVMVVAVG